MGKIKIIFNSTIALAGAGLLGIVYLQNEENVAEEAEAAEAVSEALEAARIDLSEAPDADALAKVAGYYGRYTTEKGLWFELTPTEFACSNANDSKETGRLNYYVVRADSRSFTIAFEENSQSYLTSFTYHKPKGEKKILKAGLPFNTETKTSGIPTNAEILFFQKINFNSTPFKRYASCATDGSPDEAFHQLKPFTGASPQWKPIKDDLPESVGTEEGEVGQPIQGSNGTITVFSHFSKDLGKDADYPPKRIEPTFPEDQQFLRVEFAIQAPNTNALDLRAFKGLGPYETTSLSSTVKLTCQSGQVFPISESRQQSGCKKLGEAIEAPEWIPSSQNARFSLCYIVQQSVSDCTVEFDGQALGLNTKVEVVL